MAFVSALAGGSLALGLGTPDQVANGAFAVLLSIPLRCVCARVPACVWVQH